MEEHATDAEQPDSALGEGAPAEGKARPRRWRAHAAAGVAVLLVVAAGLAVRASWGRNHPDRNIVAAYDGGVITREALLERWRVGPPDERAAMRTAEGIVLTVQSMAVHAVTERWARERRLDTREMFARAMREATQEIGIHDVAKRFHQSGVRVDEEEIRQSFEANRERYNIRVVEPR